MNTCRREEKRSTQDGKRIAYFDLMKGICITLVVIEHCNELFDIWFSEELWSVLEHLRMPLYFFLSGMFFKEYTCFCDFLIHKLNKIIVPYVFFTVIDVCFIVLYEKLSVEPFVLIRTLGAGLLYGTAHLWFLRTLFVANVFYYGFNHLVVKKYGALKSVSFLLVVVLVAYMIKNIIGDYSGLYNMYNVVIGALLVMPFFYVSNSIRVYVNQYMANKIHVLCLAVVFALIAFLTSNGGVYLSSGKIENNILLFYVAALSSILCVMCFCYLVKRLWYFSYVGRYSLIVYAIHYGLIITIMHYCPKISIGMCCCVVLAIMPVMIWFFKKFFPAFVAQRDIFVYEKGKVKVDWNVFSLKNR